MWNFFFEKLGKSFVPFSFSLHVIKKKLKPPILPKKMVKKIYDLRSFKSLEGDRWVVIQLDLSFLLYCT